MKSLILSKRVDKGRITTLKGLNVDFSTVNRSSGQISLLQRANARNVKFPETVVIRPLSTLTNKTILKTAAVPFSFKCKY